MENRQGAAMPKSMPMSAYVQSVVFVAAVMVALFASAGTLAILGFWIYVAIYIAVFIPSLTMLDPGLLRERMRPGGKRPPVALYLFTLVLFGHLIIAGLDRGRFHWSDSVPAWLQAAGLVALAAAYALVLWAMRVNRFFSSVVRIQSDRGQHVITAGPYALVRHPGYLAGFVVIVVSGIALGSWLSAAWLIVLSVPGLAYRAATEDRVLQAELPGYRDYAARVRWRVLPGIW
jgi:protein-S-isoprenylcysteine O-methyltransferase Ste14